MTKEPEKDREPVAPRSKESNQEASKWDDYYRELPDLEENAALRGFNAELVDVVRLLLPRGGSTLEAGAGGGWQSLALARAGFDVSLIDISEEALSYARRTFERSGLDAEFKRESIFSSGKCNFDLVFNLGAVEHYDLEDQATFVSGMAQRSRRFILVVVPNRHCYWYWLWRIWRTEVDSWPFGREIPRTNLEDVFQRAGVHLVGHQWLGATWTEGLVAEIPGLDHELRERILRIHQTSLIPHQQRCYLTAALGLIGEPDEPIPGGWHRLDDYPADAGIATLASELAEELARTGAILQRHVGGTRATELDGGGQQTSGAGDHGVHGHTCAEEPGKGRDVLRQPQIDEHEEKPGRAMLEEILRLKKRNRGLEAQKSELNRDLEVSRVNEASLQRKTKDLLAQTVVERQRRYSLEQTLDSIYGSKLWRTAHVYWTIRRAHRRLLGALVRTLSRVVLRVRQASSRQHLPEQRQWPQIDLLRPPRYDVLILPIIDWDFRFQRPQQIACRFANAGHRVFYLRTTFKSHSDHISWRRIRDRVYELQMPGPPNLRIYTDSLSSEVVQKWLQALGELRHEGAVEQAILLVQLPFWEPLAFAANERWGWKVVYDCMDEHGGFSTNTRRMLISEDRLIRGADLVLATSEALHQKTAPKARRSLLVRNGADFDHFNAAANHDPSRVSDKLPVIGYYGAISEWFDVELVEAAARAREDWHFVLIGSTFGADVTALQSLPNVELLGERPYSELPDHLARFDVALLPFKPTPLTKATNPVKFYEYLAAGKPVVAVELPELIPFGDLFYSFSAPEEFVPRIEAALRERSLPQREARIELARANTWQNRYELISQEILSLYGRAAIIIVSFNNLEYLSFCLESVWAKTSYPNFRVIVVDNASDEDVRDYLVAMENREERLDVIFNDRNLGFPRANNVGIRAAEDCEYLVLLNDDTVVTRGWLSRLLYHLNRPGIELVGPVTNWCGNEARIEVAYDTIDQMDEFARSYTRQHEGEATDLDVLAMYCVTMRRSLIDRIGLLDERFGLGMFEDDDFSRRVQQSCGRTVCAEDAFVHHWGRSSFGRLDQQEYDKLFDENKRKYEEKWGRPWSPHRPRRS